MDNPGCREIVNEDDYGQDVECPSNAAWQITIGHNRPRPLITYRCDTHLLRLRRRLDRYEVKFTVAPVGTTQR